MILIITHKEDYTADFLIDKLNERRIGYYRFNCDDLLNIGPSIKINDNFFDFSLGAKSIWFRRTKLPKLELDNDVNVYAQREISSYLQNLWTLFDGDWVSKPEFIYKAENKLYQLKVANRLGFNVPNSIVSLNVDEIKDFFLKNNADIIIKPIGINKIDLDGVSHSIFTNKVKESQIIGLEKYLPLPSIYQANVKKDLEFRVTVVGDKVFSAAVDSKVYPEASVDWRRKKMKFFKLDIPQEIKELCVTLVKSLGLSFGAIDLIKDIEGNYIFLEINPNGQWAWIEFETGLPISSAIIDILNK